MKSRILSFNLLLETMKKQIWVPALIFLGFFLCLPVAGTISMGWLQAAGKDHADMIREYADFLAGRNLPFYAMMMLGSAALTGVSSFSWLHSRVKTDFYHSLPIRREKVFVNQIILDMAYFAVPYLLNLVLAYAVGAVYGVLQGYAVRMSLESFLFQFLFYLVIYFVVVLAMLLSGKLLAGVMGAVVLMFYGPMLDGVLRGTASTFFSTYANEGLAFSSFLQGMSPVVKYFRMYPAGKYPALSGKSLLLCVLAAAALALLCFGLYKKRPSEAAGRTMAFYRIGKVLQYFIELLVVLGFGILFCNVTAQAHGAWLIFGVLFGGVLSHGIMEMIQEGDIRRVMAHKGMLIAAAASSLAVFGACYWDVFGYDEFLPKQEEIKAISIRSDDGYSRVEDDIQADGEVLRAMEQMASDPEVYAALKQILKTRVDQAADGDGKWIQRLQADSDSIQESVNIRYMRVTYVLASGRTVYRKYLVDFDKSQQQLLALYDSQDYKKIIYPLTVMTEDEMLNKIESGTIISIDGEYFELPGNQMTRVEFLKTYRAELMQMSSETLKRERPVGSIELMASWEYETEDGQSMTNQEYTSISNQVYYIYPSFVRTLAFLEKENIELPTSFTPESVESITVYEDDKERLIQSRKEIREMLPELVSSEVDDGIMSRLGDVTVDVRMKKDGYVNNITCIWPGDKKTDPS